MNNPNLIDKYTFRLGILFGFWTYETHWAEVEKNINYIEIKKLLYDFYHAAIDDYNGFD